VAAKGHHGVDWALSTDQRIVSTPKDRQDEAHHSSKNNVDANRQQSETAKAKGRTPKSAHRFIRKRTSPIDALSKKKEDANSCAPTAHRLKMCAPIILRRIAKERTKSPKCATNKNVEAARSALWRREIRWALYRTTAPQPNKSPHRKRKD
jgi:hypothetical protein